MICSSDCCTGCLACYYRCPKNAIVLERSTTGEQLPRIDKAKCVECGLCKKICPSLHPLEFHLPQKVYAAFANDAEDRRTCASGGLATTLSRTMLQEGGIVFGVALNKNGTFAFREINDENELTPCKGSKYVFIQPGPIYPSVKGRLDQGKRCLFIGLPCHIAGLLAFLGGHHSNLITIDLICHGAPPQCYLTEHVHEMLPFNELAFRGEKDFRLAIRRDKTYIYNESSQHDPYFYSFLQMLTFRNVCYQCPYAAAERISDITIGDFWGLDPKAFPKDFGRKSVVLIQTEKGMALFRSAQPRLSTQERSLAEAVLGNAQLQKPSQKHPKRELFLEVYRQTQSFEIALKKAGIMKKCQENRIRDSLLFFPRKIKHWIVGRRR